MGVCRTHCPPEGAAVPLAVAAGVFAVSAVVSFVSPFIGGVAWALLAVTWLAAAPAALHVARLVRGKRLAEPVFTQVSLHDALTQSRCHALPAAAPLAIEGTTRPPVYFDLAAGDPSLVVPGEVVR